MGLGSAMYTGIAGLSVYGDAMNVTGDNISNINTVGFKGNRSIFSDILANSVANGATVMQFGRGSFFQAVSPTFSQGSFETTGNATDMAIQGTGFFVVRDPSSGGTFYTRAGQYTIDKDGYLVNPSSHRMRGYRMTMDASGDYVRSGPASDISITGLQSEPRETSFVRLGANLNAAASATATFSTSFNVYNSLGEAATMTMTFTKTTTAGQWDYVLSGPSGTSVTAGASGTVTFNNQGQMTSPAADQTITVTGFPSGASDLTFNWDIIDDTTSASYNDITGYASTSVTNSIVQDGYSTGVLRGLSVDSEGIISGLFSNGQTQQLWQVQLADFLSPWALSRQGNTLFAETTQSGQPIYGIAKAGGFGTIYGSSLELSNVDLSREFVDMIQNQRAYQANSRIISTVDDMMQEVVNLKR
ncbi:MAG: flagellar hook protein FlgE [Candidatus Nitrospinota bacterium M3_3B_026]